ncbi:MAG: hypothetical protein GY870_21460, partial [archaeon]|nr:hypothetical protein [archaeon]
MRIFFSFFIQIIYMGEFTDDILRIIFGNFYQIELYIFVSSYAFIFIFFLFVAYKFYSKENKYSIKTCTVSALGSPAPDRNPKGWFFFSIAMFLSGILDFPCSIYNFRRYLLINPFLGGLQFVLNMIGIIGTFLIAFFPDTEGRVFMKDITSSQIHLITASMSIGGYILTTFVRSILFFIDCFLGSQLFTGPYLILPFSSYFLGIGCGIYHIVKWQIKCNNDNNLERWPGEGKYAFSIWEWVYFVTNTS